jgi:hypothetical protein
VFRHCKCWSYLGKGSLTLVFPPVNEALEFGVKPSVQSHLSSERLVWGGLFRKVLRADLWIVPCLAVDCSTIFQRQTVSCKTKPCSLEHKHAGLQGRNPCITNKLVHCWLQTSVPFTKWQTVSWVQSQRSELHAHLDYNRSNTWPTPTNFSLWTRESWLIKLKCWLVRFYIFPRFIWAVHPHLEWQSFITPLFMKVILTVFMFLIALRSVIPFSLKQLVYQYLSS